MSDDREEFEPDEDGADIAHRVGGGEEWVFRGVQAQKFDEAGDRFIPSVADADACLTTPAMEPWKADGETPAPAAPPEIQFGQRLRQYADQELDESGSVSRWHALRSIADAIDKDAAREIDRLERGQLDRAQYLRRKVEKAVERLQYPVETGASSSMRWTKQVLDAKPFLAELGLIFGERPEVVVDEDDGNQRGLLVEDGADQ